MKKNKEKVTFVLKEDLVNDLEILSRKIKIDKSKILQEALILYKKNNKL